MLPDVMKPCVLSCLQLGLQVTLSATVKISALGPRSMIKTVRVMRCVRLARVCVWHMCCAIKRLERLFSRAQIRRNIVPSFGQTFFLIKSVLLKIKMKGAPDQNENVKMKFCAIGFQSVLQTAI